MLVEWDGQLSPETKYTREVFVKGNFGEDLISFVSWIRIKFNKIKTTTKICFSTQFYVIDCKSTTKLLLKLKQRNWTPIKLNVSTVFGQFISGEVGIYVMHKK